MDIDVLILYHFNNTLAIYMTMYRLALYIYIYMKVDVVGSLTLGRWVTETLLHAIFCECGSNCSVCSETACYGGAGAKS